MYNEGRGLFVRDLVVKLLFVALFIFIMMWIFPMPKDLKPFYDRIFNENILIMRDTAKEYYTTERLPKNTGDTVKLTLQEMLNKKLCANRQHTANNTAKKKLR